MRTMFIAAAAGLSLAASTAAYADGGDGPAANSFFTELPGQNREAEAGQKNRTQKSLCRFLASLGCCSSYDCG